jgi:hypothetical protein
MALTSAKAIQDAVTAFRCPLHVRAPVGSDSVHASITTVGGTVGLPRTATDDGR